MKLNAADEVIHFLLKRLRRLEPKEGAYATTLFTRHRPPAPEDLETLQVRLRDAAETE